MAVRQRTDGKWPNLIKGAKPPGWLPVGGLEYVLRVKERDGLTWDDLAHRFGTTVNALKGARDRFQRRSVGAPE